MIGLLDIGSWDALCKVHQSIPQPNENDNPTITCVWRGKTGISNSPQHLIHFLKKKSKCLQVNPEVLSVRILIRSAKEYFHFYMISEWTNREAIEAYEGTEFKKLFLRDDVIVMEMDEKINRYFTYTVK